MAAKTCGECSAAMAADQRFCSDCGGRYTAPPAQSFCNGCGAMFSSVSQRFCGHCGSQNTAVTSSYRSSPSLHQSPRALSPPAVNIPNTSRLRSEAADLASGLSMEQNRMHLSLARQSHSPPAIGRSSFPSSFASPVYETAGAYRALARIGASPQSVHDRSSRLMQELETQRNATRVAEADTARFRKSQVAAMMPYMSPAAANEVGRPSPPAQLDSAWPPVAAGSPYHVAAAAAASHQPPASASAAAAALKLHAAHNLELVISTLEGSLTNARQQLAEAQGLDATQSLEYLDQARSIQQQQQAVTNQLQHLFSPVDTERQVSPSAAVSPHLREVADAAVAVVSEQVRLRELELQIYGLRSEAEVAASVAAREHQRAAASEVEREAQLTAAKQVENHLRQQLLHSFDENLDIKNKYVKIEDKSRQLEQQLCLAQQQASTAQEEASQVFETASQLAHRQEQDHAAEQHRAALRTQEEHRAAKGEEEEERAIRAEEVKLRVLEDELQQLRRQNESSELARLQSEAEQLSQLRSEAAIALAAINPIQALAAINPQRMRPQDNPEQQQQSEEQNTEPTVLVEPGSEISAGWLAPANDSTESSPATDRTLLRGSSAPVVLARRDSSPGAVRGAAWRSTHSAGQAHLTTALITKPGGAKPDNKVRDVSPEVSRAMAPYSHAWKQLARPGGSSAEAQAVPAAAPRSSSPAQALRSLLENLVENRQERTAVVERSAGELQQPAAVEVHDGVDLTATAGLKVMVVGIKNEELVGKIGPGCLVWGVNGRHVDGEPSTEVLALIKRGMQDRPFKLTFQLRDGALVEHMFQSPGPLDLRFGQVTTPQEDSIAIA